jgi:hypothetical protein
MSCSSEPAVSAGGPEAGEEIMKKITIAALGLAALAGTAMLAAPIAFADSGWGGRGGMMGGHMMGGGGMMGGSMMGGGMMGGGMQMFERIDANNDGRITQEEIDAFVAQEFAAVNTDGQAGVTIEEFEPWFWQQHREMMVRAFQRLDRDGDGVVTEEEVNAMTGSIVQRMDRTGDGAISMDDHRHRYGRDGGRRGDRSGWMNRMPGMGMGQGMMGQPNDDDDNGDGEQ